MLDGTVDVEGEDRAVGAPLTDDPVLDLGSLRRGVGLRRLRQLVHRGPDRQGLVEIAGLGGLLLRLLQLLAELLGGLVDRRFVAGLRLGDFVLVLGQRRHAGQQPRVDSEGVEVEG